MFLRKAYKRTIGNLRYSVQVAVYEIEKWYQVWGASFGTFVEGEKNEENGRLTPKKSYIQNTEVCFK